LGLVPEPKAGLREELITESLSAELATGTAPAQRDPLEWTETPRRVAAHLAQVAERLAGDRVKSGEDVDAEFSLINQAIRALDSGDATNEDLLAHPPQLLTGVLPPRSGLDEPVLPPRPLIAFGAEDLLVNGHGQPGLGAQIRSEFPSADSVDLLCSFLMWSGVRSLMPAVHALIARGGSLRILTTTYMGVTQPKAVAALVDAGADLRIAYEAARTRLHAKAWIFHRQANLGTGFVGSSNLSEAALHHGLEWNVRLSESRSPDLLSRMRAAFETHWEDPAFTAYRPGDDARLRDALDRQRHQKGRPVAISGSFVALDVRPLPHQQTMLEDLAVARERHGRHRNLVVAATGTGKTVVAALDYQRLCEQAGKRLKLLFVAHRRQILEQARSTFATTLKERDFGQIFGDGERPASGAQHVFAMVQSMSAAALSDVPAGAYDVVIVDEFHHAAAPSYQRVLSHFEPLELLGLTATPERMDGLDILSWFDGRVASELRLWEAVEDGHLCPFQYFGVDDGTDLRDLEWRRGGYRTEALDGLFTGNEMRVRRILSATAGIVEDASRMRALGFCVSVDHARYMAQEFSNAGLRSAAISGEDSLPVRNAALDRLASGQLQCVFSVDVLGEGVDVPQVDTVLLLRPTQSATVFMQQLGRGLRQHRDKRCLTVLDFIGQQHRRFRFDVKLRALLDPANGRLRDQAEDEFPYLPAGCEISLDRTSRDIVLRNLREAVGAGETRALVEDLQRIGDVTLDEFLRATDRSPEGVYRNRDRTWAGLRSAAGFALENPGPEETPLLRAAHRLLHWQDPERVRYYGEVLGRRAPPHISQISRRERRMLTMLVLALWGRSIPHGTLAAALDALWIHPNVRQELVELVTALDARAQHRSGALGLPPEVPLFLHAQYSRDEVLAAFGDSAVEKPSQLREGVRWLEQYETDLLFVTLRKSERRYSPATRYADYAISRDLFHWETQNRDHPGTRAGRRYLRQREDRTGVLLFVRESESLANRAAAPFTCLGFADYVSHTGARPIQITWRLRRPMPPRLFETAALVAPGF
jgi:superfamily II DNA or RNA helicase/HKD family nuclease